jgi:hypothetical protein
MAAAFEILLFSDRCITLYSLMETEQFNALNYLTQNREASAAPGWNKAFRRAHGVTVVSMRFCFFSMHRGHAAHRLFDVRRDYQRD